MKRRKLLTLLLISTVTSMIFLGARGVIAEDIDPDGDGSQYAWAENAGWLNLEPGGDGGPGVVLGDFALTGFMWGENAGWISLSCEDTGSCAAVHYGVRNNGAGNLMDYAWGENVGWISFSCENTGTCGTISYGVTVNPGTGEFSGHAWGENIGWINFAPAAGGGAKTSWRGYCTDGDGDGYAAEGGDCGPVDCDDTNPAVNPGAAEAGHCDDSIDNDCDGLVDILDPDCFAQPTETTCDDGQDNDFDGLTDCADPDCFGLPG